MNRANGTASGSDVPTSARGSPTSPRCFSGRSSTRSSASRNRSRFRRTRAGVTDLPRPYGLSQNFLRESFSHTNEVRNMSPEFRAGERDVPSIEERKVAKFQAAIEKRLGIRILPNTALDSATFDMFDADLTVAEACDELRAEGLA